jgi:hypothetical protein
MRLVKSLICERLLLRVDKRVLWYCHNAINVYHVVVPWRGEAAFQDMGKGRAYPRQDRVNNKGDIGCHPNTQTNKNPYCQPAQVFTRVPTVEEVSTWLTPGSDPWYFAQGLTPPGKDGE